MEDGAALRDSEDPLVAKVLSERYRLASRTESKAQGDHPSYLAEDLDLGREVLLTIWNADRPLPDVEEFQQDASLLASLDHPSLAGVVAHGVHEGRPFVVWDLADGTPLDELLDAGRLAPEDGPRIATQLAQCLAYVRGAGVTHGHLDASHVRLRSTDEGWRVKLTEVGMAGLFQRVDADGTRDADLRDAGSLLLDLLAVAPPAVQKESEPPPRTVRRFQAPLLQAVVAPWEGAQVVGGEALRPSAVPEAPSEDWDDASWGGDPEADGDEGWDAAASAYEDDWIEEEVHDEEVPPPSEAPTADAEDPPVQDEEQGDGFGLPDVGANMPDDEEDSVVVAWKELGLPPPRAASSRRVDTDRPPPITTSHLEPVPPSIPTSVGLSITVVGAAALIGVLLYAGGRETPDSAGPESSDTAAARDDRTGDFRGGVDPEGGDTTPSQQRGAYGQAAPDEEDGLLGLAPAADPERARELSPNAAPTETPERAAGPSDGDALPEEPSEALPEADTVPPEAGRALPRDPWAAQLPEPLATLSRQLAREGGDATALRASVDYARDHPDDARALLLTAHAFMDRGWRSDALSRYRAAYRVDPTVRGDPRMLSDLVTLAARPDLGDSAATTLQLVYGPEALTAIDAAIEASSRDDVRRRLRLARLPLQRAVDRDRTE